MTGLSTRSSFAPCDRQAYDGQLFAEENQSPGKRAQITSDNTLDVTHGALAPIFNRGRMASRFRIALLRVLQRILPDVRRARRERIREGTLPEAWRALISARVLRYRNLSRSDQAELEKQILVFLNEKIFEGCAGLEVTDEVRVTIAAQACMLSLKRDLDYYPGVKVILVYPGAYRPRYPRHTIPRPEYENPDMRLGESRGGDGVVVISWSGVDDPSAALGPHRNLTLHEFAHQIDTEDGVADGIPVLDSSSMYRTWAVLVADQFADHVARTEAGIEGVLDPYGSRNPGEFFAVAVEAFFENPTALRQERPSLYDLLRGYFRQDPA